MANLERSLLVFVGWRVEEDASLTKNIKVVEPVFEDSARGKSAEEKLDEWRSKRREGLASSPYGANLSHVHLAIPALELSETFEVGKAVIKAAKKPSNVLPVAVQVSTWLKRHVSDNEMLLFGFDTRGFIKQLGLECARRGKPAPAELWFGNSDHRDVESALVPRDPYGSAGVTLSDALQVLGIKPILTPDVKDPYDYRPGEDPTTDAVLAMRVAARLGFITLPPSLDTEATTEQQPAAAAG